MMRGLLRFSILALSATAMFASLEFLGRSWAEGQARGRNVTPREAQSSGTISGQLLGDDGQPVEGSIVRLVAIGTASREPRTVHTDAEGNFRFTGLQPRVYNVWAESPGYVSELPAASDLRYHRVGQSISMKLVKGGVITGKVTNIAGDPAVEIPVRAIRVRDAEGRPLGSESIAGTRHTDDRGIYRIFGLRSGSYLVMVNQADPNNSPILVGSDVVMTYHPSAGRESASEVNVQVGAEVTGIDLRYRSEQGHNVSGSVSEGRDFGSSEIGAWVSLTLPGGNIPVGSAMVRNITEGRFTIPLVADGEYYLIARMSIGRDEQVASVPQRIVVRGADVSGIKLILSPNSSISGRVLIENALAPAQFKGCRQGRVSFLSEAIVSSKVVGNKDETAYFRILQSAVDEKGDFTIPNLTRGNHRLGIDLPGANWYLKSITMANTKGSGKPVDLVKTGVNLKSGERLSGVTMTLAEGAATISGRLKSDPEASRTRWRVHLVPEDPALADDALRYGEMIAGADGSFRIEHIAPGRYRILAAAIPDDQPLDSLQSPAAWDADQRAKLRLAAASGQSIELGPCAQVKDLELKR